MRRRGLLANLSGLMSRDKTLAKRVLDRLFSARRSIVPVAMIVFVALVSRAGAQTVVARITINPEQSIGVTTLSLGVTFTQTTPPIIPDMRIRQQLQSVLPKAGPLENSFIMGWGAGNPEPSPGSYNWKELDNRLALEREAGGIPVISLCCAPDWLKGGAPGETNWAHVEEAPLRAHYGDFADLAAAIARRYPAVKYYQVWNEFKGFWNPAAKRWGYDDYTDFYNQVYEKLKAVSPEIQVGGPYALIRSNFKPPRGAASALSGAYGDIDQRMLTAIEYWLSHKKGADFISVDGKLHAHDGLPGDLFAATAFYADVARWIKARTNLPIWWSEWYSAPHEAPEAERLALMARTLMRMADTAAVALFWGPDEGGNGRGSPRSAELDPLWQTDAMTSSVNPKPFLSILSDFTRCFPMGTTLVSVSSNSNDIALLGSRTCIMMVNQTATAKTALIGERSEELAPYEVKFLKISGAG